MKILMIMAALFCSTACGQPAEKMAQYPVDTIKTSDGSELKITFFAHASLAFEYDSKFIYIDPVSASADYAALPKADVIFVTHSHGDHLDSAAIASLATAQTTVVCNAFSVKSIPEGIKEVKAVKPDDKFDLTNPTMNIEVVAAYNTSEGHTQFHPREQELCGYVLTLGSERIYIAGDSEPTPEMMALPGIDIAFLPVNQPYTMTEEQAAMAARAIAPKILYPYHTGQVEHKTDLDKLQRLLDGSGIEVRIRPME